MLPQISKSGVVYNTGLLGKSHGCCVEDCERTSIDYRKNVV